MKEKLLSVRHKKSLHLGHLDIAGFGMILVGSADQKPKKRVKLFPTVAVYCTTDWPNHSKDKKTLKPTGYLRTEERNTE